MVFDSRQQNSTKIEVSVEDILSTQPMPQPERHEANSSEIERQDFPKYVNGCPGISASFRDLVWFNNPQNKSIKTLFVLSPDLNISPESYRSLAKNLLKTYPVSAAVAALRFRSSIPNPLQLVTSLQMARRIAAQCGAKPDLSFYLIGHGLGGVMTQKVAPKIKSLKGVVLLSSFLTKSTDPGIGSESISKFPVSVLTLAGEWDSTNRIGFVYREFDEFQRNYKSTEAGIDAFRTKPVVVIERLNGSIFLDAPRDISAEISTDLTLKEAVSEISRSITHFASLNDPDVSLGVREKSAKALIGDYRKTEFVLEAYKQSKAFDQSICFSVLEYWAGKQGWASKSWSCDMQVDQDLWEAAISKPVFYRSEVGNRCTIHQFLHKKFQSLELGDRPFASEAAHCKYPSADAFQQTFPGIKASSSFDCAAANKWILKNAEKMLSKQQQKKYASEGVPIELADAVQTADAVDWLSTQLQVNRNKKLITIVGVDFKEKQSSLAGDAYGLHYCKLITMTKAVELLTVDGLVGAR